jgi:transposase
LITIINGREESKLDDWIKRAGESGVAEIVSFVRGLEQDKLAVQAALKYEWSRDRRKDKLIS